MRQRLLVAFQWSFLPLLSQQANPSFQLGTQPTTRITFPSSLAAWCGHVTKLRFMRSNWKRCVGLAIILFRKEQLQPSSPLSFLLSTRNIFALEFKQPSCAPRWCKISLVGQERRCLGPWWSWSCQDRLGLPTSRFLLHEIINTHIFKPLLSFSVTHRGINTSLSHLECH